MSESRLESKLPPIDQSNNWRQLDANEVKNLTPIQRSRYMAYEDLPQHIDDAVRIVQNRLCEHRRKRERQNRPVQDEQEDERNNYEKLHYTLKATEARNRLRNMRFRTESLRNTEIAYVVACQPVAVRAVRLQCLIQPFPEYKDKRDRHHIKRIQDLIKD